MLQLLWWTRVLLHLVHTRQYLRSEFSNSNFGLPTSKRSRCKMPSSWVLYRSSGEIRYFRSSPVLGLKLVGKWFDPVRPNLRKCWYVISVSSPGSDEKLIEKLSEDARGRFAIAISAFTAINNQLVQGHIKISLLNIIFERRNAFLDLLKIGKKQFSHYRISPKKYVDLLLINNSESVYFI